MYHATPVRHPIHVKLIENSSCYQNRPVVSAPPSVCHAVQKDNGECKVKAENGKGNDSRVASCSLARNRRKRNQHKWYVGK